VKNLSLKIASLFYASLTFTFLFIITDLVLFVGTDLYHCSIPDDFFIKFITGVIFCLLTFTYII